MNLKDEKKWDEYVEINTDYYGKCCIDVARKVMEILDEDKPFEANALIKQVNKGQGLWQITLAQAGMVAQIISQCHERGEEFRRQWNLDHQYKNEGEKANENGGILNPAIVELEE